MVRRDSVPDFYAAADILVAPSLNEMSPKVVLEAMGYSMAVIGTQVGAIPRLLGHNRGVLIEPGDSEQIAAGIREFCQSPTRTLQIQRNAWTFSTSNSLESLNDQIREVLNLNLGIRLGQDDDSSRLPASDSQQVACT